jgi:ABC-type transporter Mla MlaB component
MLNITISRDDHETTFALAGRLASPWTEELDRCWREAADARRSSVVVDLTGVTFIAPEGKALLARMWRQGAKLHATGCLNECIVEQITREGPAGWRIL